MFCTYMYICVYTSTVLLTIKDELLYCIFFRDCFPQRVSKALIYSYDGISSLIALD